jgi:hypothetical protein
MKTVDEEVGIGLAYLHARQELHLRDCEAYDWAREHWMCFLQECDSDTGRLLLKLARLTRDRPRRRK